MELSLHRFCRVAAGGAHSLVVTERLEVLAWGSNSHGQVGNGSLEDVLNPTTVVEPGRAQYVFAGRNFSLMIDVDGALFAWGCNEDQILGLGTGNLKQQTPAPLNLARRIKHAAGGWKHILAVTEDGDLLSWGSNDYGQLGDGTKARRSAPQATPLPQARRAVAVACGAYHSLVLTDTGEVLAAGMGYSSDTQSFVQVIRMGVCMICAGTSHNLAITKTGTVLAWGANDHGQIGNGLLDFQPGPCAVQRSQLIIAAGGAHSLCASDAFQVMAWGHGVLPADDFSFDCPARYSTAEPQPLNVSEGAFAIAAGDDHTVIVGPLGQVSAYGANTCGQVGNNSTRDVGRYLEILSPGTVEVLSREALLQAAMKGPAEYLMDKEDECQVSEALVQLAFGQRTLAASGNSCGVPDTLRQAAGVSLARDLSSGRSRATG